MLQKQQFYEDWVPFSSLKGAKFRILNIRNKQILLRKCRQLACFGVDAMQNYEMISHFEEEQKSTLKSFLTGKNVFFYRRLALWRVPQCVAI